MRPMLKKLIWNIIVLGLVIVLPGWGRVDAVIASRGLRTDNSPSASTGMNNPEVGLIDAIDALKSAFTLAKTATTTVTFKNNSGASTKMEFTLSNKSAGWDVTLADSLGLLKIKPNSHFESNVTVAKDAYYTVNIHAVALDPVLTEGDFTEPVLEVYPSGGVVSSDSCQLRFAIPSSFVYAVSDSQRRNSLRLAYLSPKARMEATELLSFAGNNLAVSAAMVGENKYVLAWENRITDQPVPQNVEFSIFNQVGGALIHRKELFNNTLTSNVDSVPFVAASPNGKFGILFIRKVDSSYKISFQLVNQDGTNVNNASVPLQIDAENSMLFAPRLVGLPVETGQYRMLAVWWNFAQEIRGASINITDSNNIFVETGPTSLDSTASKPVLTPLSDSRSFLAYNKGTTTIKANDIRSDLYIEPGSGIELGGTAPIPHGAVQFPDTKNILLAWTDGDQINLTLFNEGVTTSEAINLDLTNIPVPDAVSITLDHQNRAIIFWTDAVTNDLLYYALVNSSGIVVTPPMVFRESGGNYEFIISPNGQGIVGLDGLYAQFLPNIAR